MLKKLHNISFTRKRETAMMSPMREKKIKVELTMRFIVSSSFLAVYSATYLTREGVMPRSRSPKYPVTALTRSHMPNISAPTLFTT